MTREELAYIAGFIDGEGCISIGLNGLRQTTGLAFSIVNTNKQILEWIQSKIGGKILRRTYHTSNNSKETYQLYKSGSRAYQILQLFEPYIRLKTKQLQIGLAYGMTIGSAGKHITQVIKEYRLQLYKQMKRLNKRGIDE